MEARPADCESTLLRGMARRLQSGVLGFRLSTVAQGDRRARTPGNAAIMNTPNLLALRPLTDLHRSDVQRTRTERVHESARRSSCKSAKVRGLGPSKIHCHDVIGGWSLRV